MSDARAISYQAAYREVLLHEARSLLQDGCDSPEYERAVVELVTRMVGVSHEWHDDIAVMLRPPVAPCCEDAAACDLCGEAKAEYRLTDIGVCADCVSAAIDHLKEA